MFVCGLTVMDIESDTSPVAEAVTVVVQGSGAVPPYAGVKVVVTWPFGMVDVAATATHAGFADARFTVIACRAAIGVPLLSRRTVNAGDGSSMWTVADA